jgi:hypothetical protein
MRKQARKAFQHAMYIRGIDAVRSSLITARRVARDERVVDIRIEERISVGYVS